MVSCHINNQDKGKWFGDKKNLLIRTKNIEQFYREEGYSVITCWECQYDINIAPLSNKYESDYLTRYFTKNRGTLKQEKIKRDIANGKLYGFCQVDMECPDGNTWPDDVTKPPFCDISPKLFYSEHPPIFANTEIPFSDLGQTMQEHIEKMDLSKEPQRYLCGGLKCTKLFLSTNYVKYLMSIGVRLLKCYLLLEYTASNCFREFKNDVVQARVKAMGSSNPNEKIIGATMKQLSNSFYGSMLLAKHKYRETVYSNDLYQVKTYVNQPEFRGMECIGKNLYEVQNNLTIILSLCSWGRLY